MLAFPRLHQRYHRRGQQSEGVSPTPGPALPQERRAGSLSTDHTLHPVRGDSLPRPVVIDSHDTASATHRGALGFTRPHETGVSGRGESGERGGVLNICIKGKNKTKKVYQLGRGNIYLL